MANYSGIVGQGSGLRLEQTPTARMSSPPKWRYPKRVTRKRQPSGSGPSVHDKKAQEDAMQNELDQRELERSNAEYDARPQRKLEESLAKEELARSQNRRYDMAYGRDEGSVATRERMRNEGLANQQADFQRKFMRMAELSDSLASAPIDEQGMIKIPREARDKLPGILPDFQTMQWSDKKEKLVPVELFGVVEGEGDQRVLSFYQSDGSDGPPKRVSNRGRPVQMPLGVLTEFSKIGQKIRGDGSRTGDKDAQPAQVKLTEYIKQNQGDPEWQQAWELAQSKKVSQDELTAKFYTELLKQNVDSYGDPIRPKAELEAEAEAFREFLTRPLKSRPEGKDDVEGLQPPSAAEKPASGKPETRSWLGGLFSGGDAAPQTGLAPPVARPQVVPQAAAVPQAAVRPPQADPIIGKAVSAIQRGADPAAVRQRLIERGYSEQQLQQAGL